MNIKSQKDFFSGLLFMAAGVSFAWGASFYSIGNAARMGPGYLPLVLGVLLALLGSVITFKALVVETEDGEKVGVWAWKPLFFILEANVVFGLMLGGFPYLNIQPMGLIVGIYALTFIASRAGSGFKFKEVLLLATALAVLSYGVFIVLLKLAFPVWPAYITG